jgi:hypothetical protein
MNMKLTVAIPLLILLCFGIAAQTFAQTRAPGVKAGDYLTFSITTRWNSSNSSLTVPDPLVGINNTDYFKVSVSDVTAFNVTATNIWRFKNGTELPSLVILDTDTGSMYYMNGYQGFFDANLGAGDLLHPSGSDLITINQTISREYAGAKRDINVVTLSAPIVNNATNVTLGREEVNFYIDKATGVLVELFDTTEYFDPTETGSTIWLLTETNLWTVSAPQLELPLPLPIIVAIVAVIIVVIVAVLYFKTRKKRKKKSF